MLLIMLTKLVCLLVLAVAACAETVTVTAYCACKKCCGENAKGITASGKRPIEGRTCAASRSIPFGSVVYLPGIGSLVVEDRLAKRYDDRIDVYIADHNRALKFGKRKLNVSWQRQEKAKAPRLAKR